MDAAYYWVAFSRRGLMRGDTLKEAESLQGGFRRAMAAAGRSGARGFTVTTNGLPVYAEKNGKPVAP